MVNTALIPLVIPRSEVAETKPPYVCPGCFIHTYSNNMINRFSCSVIQSNYYYRMTLGSKEKYIKAAANYAWVEPPQALARGEACLTAVIGILLVSQTSIIISI
jgi:hypothetical protein